RRAREGGTSGGCGRHGAPGRGRNENRHCGCVQDRGAARARKTKRRHRYALEGARVLLTSPPAGSSEIEGAVRDRGGIARKTNINGRSCTRSRARIPKFAIEENAITNMPV